MVFTKSVYKTTSSIYYLSGLFTHESSVISSYRVNFLIGTCLFTTFETHLLFANSTDADAQGIKKYCKTITDIMQNFY